MSTVVFTEGPTGPEAPVKEEGAAAPNSRPEGLPENFESVEALVNSYKAAQAELTKVKQGKAPEKPEGQQDNPEDGQKAEATEEGGEEEGEGQDKEQTESALPENLMPFSEEFAKDGKLSEDSYTKLAELGYSKEVVDAYIKGVTGTGETEPPSPDDVKKIIDSVGGEEQFGEMQKWAGENLSDDDLNAYNAAITSKATSKMAVEWLKSRMEAVEGFTPKVKVTGGNAGGDTVTGYTSTAELSRDQRNPLYKSGDPAFHAMVQARLSKTTAF